jgi:hypothetical protein
MIATRVIKTGGKWIMAAVNLLCLSHPQTAAVFELDSLAIGADLTMTNMMWTLLTVHARPPLR